MLPSPPPEVCTPYEVIVVLGAAVWPAGQASPALQRRVLHAITLMQHGVAPCLLLTGGIGTYPPSEAQVMQHLAQQHGIPGSSMVLEEQATSTFESAMRCSQLLRQHGWSRVLLVTDRYHLLRALLAFRGFGVRAAGSAVPGKPARRRWKRCATYAREGCALVWYLFRLLPILLQRRWRSEAPGRRIA